MPIDVVCSGCRQKLRAKDSLAGKTVACPKCALKIAIPAPTPIIEEAAEIVEAEAVPVAAVVQAPEVEDEDNEIFQAQVEEAQPPEPPALKKKKSGGKKSGQKKKRVRNAAIDSAAAPFWLRHLHWLLVLALIPLAISLLNAQSNSVIERVQSTLEKMTEAQRAQVLEEMDDLPDNPRGREEFFAILPNNRCDGAFLARNSKLQWVFALGSIALFLGFFSLLAMTGSAHPLHLLLIGQLTATVGIVLLFGFQWIADLTQYVWVRGSGVLVALFWAVKGIGYSYRMAEDPQFGFFPSFLGFTFGVGLCEEVVKLLPVLVKVRTDDKFTWHGAFLWGLASGAGFGIAEGIIYSANLYNGVSGWDMYAVRFISCVALHALWTGSAAIMVYLFRDMFHGLDNWFDIFFPLLLVVGIPMVLHGLYDTLLKKDMEMGALLVAVLSFGFLAALNTWLHHEDVVDADDEMPSRYKKQRA